MTKPRRSSRTSKARRRPAIHVAIFDLDDTLYDCYRQRVRVAHRHAAEAMARAGLPGTPEQIFKLRMRAYRQDPQLRHIDKYVLDHYGIADGAAIATAARDAFFSCPVGKLRLFRSSRRLLRELHRRGVRVFVVSYGDPEVQRAKFASLGLDKEPAIEGAYFADRGKALTKDAAFQQILKRTGADANHVLVVGDRCSSEIKAGNSLGMHTVRMLGGEFAKLGPASREEEPDFEVRKLEELLKLPFQLGAV